MRLSILFTWLLLVLSRNVSHCQTIHKAVAKPVPIKRKIAVNKKTSLSLSKLFYVYKDGVWIKYQGHANTLGEFWKELGINGRTYVNSPNCDNEGKEQDCLTMVGYKLFTDEPQWALMKDTTNINGLARKFDIEEFMSSWKLEFYLKGGLKSKSFNDVFLLETLKAPDSKTSFVDANRKSEVWHYNSLGLSITLRNGIATSFVKTD